MKFPNLSLLFAALIVSVTTCSETEEQRFVQTEILPYTKDHTHGSTVVELPNGDLLAAWFQGSGERWADDVQIRGARLTKGSEAWSEPFIMADVPEFPDINPVLFLDQEEQLWLVWYTVIANQWSTSLPKYRISNNYMQQTGPPEWEWQDVIHFKPGDPAERGIQPNDRFVESVREQTASIRANLAAGGATEEQLKMYDQFAAQQISGAMGEDLIRRGEIIHEDGSREQTQLGYPYFRRMGWQTKNKAVLVGDRILIPFYSDGLEMSIMAYTDDLGDNWQFSTPLVGIANIQPTMAFKEDGTIVAYMRDNGPPPNLHPISESHDQGMSWSPVTDSEIPNPGSGSDIVTLFNGYWVLAYNDTEQGRHSLAISLSMDEGSTWSFTRHLELDERGPELATQSSYPSIIEGRDGSIHVVYSYHRGDTKGTPNETIKYARISEEWIRAGDQ